MKQIYSKYKNAKYIIEGDMNLTCIDQKNENPSTGANDLSFCAKFLITMDERGLTQDSKEPTPPVSGKILDLVLTNHPSSVNKTSSVSGISDHKILLTLTSRIDSRNYHNK